MATNKITLTSEQKGFLVENFDKMSRAKMASHLGISGRTLHRMAQELGLKIHQWKSPEFCERVVRENIDKMCFHDIDLKFGLSRGRAAKVARRLGLEQPAAIKERVKAETMKNLVEAHRDFKAIAAKCKTLRKMDELRISCELPRKTKYRLRCISKRAYKVKWRLVRIYGYYECEDEPYTVLYDENTKRVRRNRKYSEEYYSKKYGLCFEKIED